MSHGKEVFILRSGPAPWGDYGHILMNGMSQHLGLNPSTGLIQLERTGPFVSPISFPGVGDVVVTDSFRKELEGSGLRGLDFAPVELSRIVELDWHLWDLDADEPPLYPDEGEPEGYILDREHSSELANYIGPLWQLLLKRTAREERIPDVDSSDVTIRLHTESLGDLDFFRADTTFYNYVTARARDWLTQCVPNYVSFEQCELTGS
jgi:hypothetical protein